MSCLARAWHASSAPGALLYLCAANKKRSKSLACPCKSRREQSDVEYVASNLTVAKHDANSLESAASSQEKKSNLNPQVTKPLTHISADEAAQDSVQASAHYCGSAATTTAVVATRGARPAPLLMEMVRAKPFAAASPARRGPGRAPGAYHLIPGAAACRRRPTSSAATHRRPAGSAASWARGPRQQPTSSPTTRRTGPGSCLSYLRAFAAPP